MALFAVAGLHFTLPPALQTGPSWLMLAVVSSLLLPITVSRLLGRMRLNQVLGYLLLVIVTASMGWSLAQLVIALPAHLEAPVALFRSAAALWITNILVFASWYWRLDAGGPHARDQRSEHTEGAFLFAQMSLPPARKGGEGDRGWSPRFIDYLFLAFNTSTAFSPTDAAVLSRWAKLAMMVQALISMATVVLLAARAVNIL